MNLFGCKFCEKDGDETDCDRKNFDTLLWALVTVFQVVSVSRAATNKLHNILLYFNTIYKRLLASCDQYIAVNI